jgi:hypothetical protein
MPFESISKQIKTTKEDILAELQHGLEHNTAVGIQLKDTRELMTAGVLDVELDALSGDFIIALREQDLHGYPLERTRILLDNIDRVIHFNITFDDPQYVKVRRIEKFKA